MQDAVVIGLQDFHFLKIDLASLALGLIALRGADGVRGCFLKLCFFYVQKVFNEMSQYQKMYLSLRIYHPTNLCGFYSGFSPGIFSKWMAELQAPEIC